MGGVIASQQHRRSTRGPRIYRFIYALPRGELASHGVILRSTRTRRTSLKRVGERGAPIVGWSPSNQPYLTMIADELNDRPRAALGYYTPREKFEELLKASVATLP